MSPRRRRPYPAIVALLLALPGCAPQAVMPGTVPAVGSQPAAGSTSPQTPGLASPVRPVKGDMTATVVFPAGSLGRLQRGLRVQALVSPQDLAEDDLTALTITVNGQPLTRELISFHSLEWNAQGELKSTLRVRDVDLSGPVTLSLSTPSRNLELRAVILDASAAQTVIDVRSTARALIVERLAQDGRTASPDEISERAVTLVANRLASAIAAIGITPLLADPSLTAAVTAGATSQTDGTDPTAVLNGGTGSGGGGSAGGTTTTTDPIIVANLSLQSAQATVGLPQVFGTVAGSGKLFASIGGLIHESTDSGVTWTALAGSPYAYPLTVDGANLIGYYNDSVWSIPVAGGSKTTLGFHGQNGLPSPLMPHTVFAGGGGVWIFNRNDNKVYFRPGSGIWEEGGTGFPGGDYPTFAQIGADLYAVTTSGVYALAAAAPSATWTQVTGANVPASGKQAHAANGRLYVTCDDKVHVRAADGSWTADTVDTPPGLTLAQVADDGTDLYVAGSATPNGKPVGYLYKRPLDHSTGWTLVSSGFRYPWDRQGLMAVSNGKIQLGAMHYDGTAWTTTHQQLANYDAQGAMATAGGHVWLVDDDTVWRRPAAGGAWTAITSGLPASRYNPNAYSLFAAGNQLFHVPNQASGQLYALDASQSSPTWGSFGSGLPGRPERLAADATHLYAGISSANNVQVYRVPLAGGAWQTFGPVQAVGAQPFRGLDAANGVVTICAADAVYQYNGSWTPLGGAFSNASGIQTFGSRLFLFLSYQGANSVVREWDGTAWQDFAGMPTNNNTVFSKAADRLVLGSPYGGIYVITAHATSWTKVSDLNVSASNVVYEPGSGRYVVTTFGEGMLQAP